MGLAILGYISPLSSPTVFYHIIHCCRLSSVGDPGIILEHIVPLGKYSQRNERAYTIRSKYAAKSAGGIHRPASAAKPMPKSK